MSISQDALFDAALALPPDSRAVLAKLLERSLPATPAEQNGQELGVEERAALLTAHFHAAKQAALQRARQISETDEQQLPGARK